MIAFHTQVLLTISFAAIVTYLLRFGGLMLASKLPHSGKCKRFMDALPGTILLSLIAPGIVSAGLWGGIAALATALCAYKTRNAFLSMLLGVTLVALQRHL
jgi:uncharacterized membrane protein